MTSWKPNYFRNIIVFFVLFYNNIKLHEIHRLFEIKKLSIGGCEEIKIKSNFKKALKILAKRMTNIDWVIIGSTNMALQEMDVSPKDIDAVVSIKDFNKLQKIFPDFIEKFVKISKLL